MAKKVATKKVKEETLETILFNCRNHLRGKAQMTDKRDLLLTLVFIKFLGDRFNQQRESLKADFANQGIKDEGFIQMQLDSPFSYQKDDELEDDADVQTAYCQYMACSGYGISLFGLLVEGSFVAHCHCGNDGKVLFFDMEGTYPLFYVFPEVVGFQDGAFQI